jgi:hypothetical protein
MKNNSKRQLTIASILILIYLVWLFINDLPRFQVLITFLGFGVIGSIGAVIVDFYFT